MADVPAFCIIMKGIANIFLESVVNFFMQWGKHKLVKNKIDNSL